MKILLVSPHRDDAAFSLGLSVAVWLGLGHTVTVLNCFTQSAYAPFASDVELVHENDRVSFVSALRRKEDVAWNKLLRSRVVFRDLDLLDGPLRLACPVDEVLTADIRPGDRAVARVAGAVRKLIEQAAGSPLAVVAPLTVGGHIDHRVVRQAVLEAVAGRGTPLAFYEDLPYIATEREPGVTELLASLPDNPWHSCFATTPSPDVAAEIIHKRRMADCYDSQVDRAVAQQLAEFSRHYNGRERLWANETWHKSELAVRE